MLFFLLYQALPLAILWFALVWFCRHPARARFAVPVVFAAGALAQFILWRGSAPDLENPDSVGFWRLGHGLETDLRAQLYRPKLYPLLLGLFHDLKAVTFAQCLLKLGMGVFILRFARVCAFKPATSAFALALFFADNLWLRAPLAIYDTTLFGFLFLAAMVLAVDVWTAFSLPKFAAFCAAAGLTALCRQVADPALALAGAAVLAAALWHKPESWRIIAACSTAGMALAFAGAIANGLGYGVYKRSVALGVNIYTHTAYYRLNDPADAEWAFIESKLPGARRQYPPWRTEYAFDMPWTVNDLPHRLERKLGSADAGEILANDALLVRRSLAWMQGKPGSYLASVVNEGKRALCKCEGDYPEPFIATGGTGSRIERGLTHLPLWLMLAAAMAGLITGAGRRMAAALPLAAAGTYLALVAAIQIVLCRYGLPAWPLLLLAACAALDRLPDWFPFPQKP